MQWVTVVVTAATIGSWSFWGPLGLEAVFGSMGVVGIIPVAVFFSLGLLDSRDFNRAINWSVLILIGGGLALGHLMERSHLLDIISGAMQQALEGRGLWTVLAVISTVMSVFSNFVSSVVAAVITLPIIAQVGKQVGSPAGLIIGSTLVSTAAMALPVSSFPNANSFAVRRPGAANKLPPKRELSREHKTEIRAAFDQMDTDKNGVVDAEEFKAAMRALGFSPKSGEIASMDYDEFYHMMMTKMLQRDHARQVQAASGAMLEVKDYIVAGSLVTGTALLLMVTLGYGSILLMKL